MGGCRKIAEKYREIMIEKKLATVQGVAYRDRVRTALIQYHGKDFLGVLLSENVNSMDWIELFCTSALYFAHGMLLRVA